MGTELNLRSAIDLIEGSQNKPFAKAVLCGYEDEYTCSLPRIRDLVPNNNGVAATVVGMNVPMDELIVERITGRFYTEEEIRPDVFKRVYIGCAVKNMPKGGRTYPSKEYHQFVREYTPDSKPETLGLNSTMEKLRQHRISLMLSDVRIFINQPEEEEVRPVE